MTDEIYIEQRRICEKIGSDLIPVSNHDIVGVAIETFSTSQQPINGLRHPLQGGTSGWFIWAGEYLSVNDFFKPLHANHIIDINPQVLNYLALAPGWRFLIDNKGYEDIWFDETLLNV